jgi:hypothetical protein
MKRGNTFFLIINERQKMRNSSFFETLESVLSDDGAAFDSLWDALESFHEKNSEIVNYLKDELDASSEEIAAFRNFLSKIYGNLETLMPEEKVQWAGWHEVQTLILH